MSPAYRNEVDPSRLHPGRWSHRDEKQMGEGDICASYSADVIAMQGRVRKPFSLKGRLWTCIGIVCAPRSVARAYRLTPLTQFEGKSGSYAEITADAEASRHCPQGFYHGIRVVHRSASYVIEGPPIDLIPGLEWQSGLFTCEKIAS